MKRRVAHVMRRTARMLIAKSNLLDPPNAEANVFMSAMASRAGQQAGQDLAHRF